MKRKGPILTLAAGAGLAAIMMVLNLNANATTGDGYGNTAADASTPAATTAAPTTAPTVPPTKPAGAQVTYAGNVGGGGATLAIAIKDGKAVAYVCDGRKAEAWLQGTADNGELVLSGGGGANLTGTFGNGRAKGSVTAAGKSWSFDLAAVAPPSGLYRAAADVRGARIVGGWIVLADGTQVGVVSVDGTPQPAPALDPAAGTAEVNGAAVNVAAVDGTGLN